VPGCPPHPRTHDRGRTSLTDQGASRRTPPAGRPAPDGGSDGGGYRDCLRWARARPGVAAYLARAPRRRSHAAPAAHRRHRTPGVGPRAWPGRRCRAHSIRRGGRPARGDPASGVTTEARGCPRTGGRARPARSGGIPGLKLRELLTLHTLDVRLRRDPTRWQRAKETTEAVRRGGDWRAVLTALGYELERRRQRGYLARSDGRPVAVIHPKADPIEFARLDEEGRPPEGGARSCSASTSPPSASWPPRSSRTSAPTGQGSGA
jgi:hypothetical protein